jgi:hypothetical protein
MASLEVYDSEFVLKRPNHLTGNGFFKGDRRLGRQGIDDNRSGSLAIQRQHGLSGEEIKAFPLRTITYSFIGPLKKTCLSSREGW